MACDFGFVFHGDDIGPWPHGKTVLGRILWHATFGRAQGDGGGHHGAGIRDWAGLTGLFLDFGIGLSTQYLWVAAYFGVSTSIMMIGVRRYRDEVPERTRHDVGRTAFECAKSSQDQMHRKLFVKGAKAALIPKAMRKDVR